MSEVEATKLLDEQITKQVEEVFAELQSPVEVLFFGKKTDCDYCPETRQLLEELIPLSAKLHLSVYDLDEDADVAQQYHVDKAPGIVIAGKDGDQVVDFGVRYAGMPSGHEFTSLINDLILVSTRNTALSAETRAFLAGLTAPVHLQVFVTPTCPYCPRAVVLAHRLAIESPMVQAEMVEATEFPELSERFAVSGVPQTTINAGAGTVIGAYPEDQLIAEIKSALQAG